MRNLILIILSLVFVACGGDDGNGSSTPSGGMGGQLSASDEPATGGTGGGDVTVSTGGTGGSDAGGTGGAPEEEIPPGEDSFEPTACSSDADCSDVINGECLGSTCAGCRRVDYFDSTCENFAGADLGFVFAYLCVESTLEDDPSFIYYGDAPVELQVIWCGTSPD